MLFKPEYDENGKKVLCEMNGVNPEMLMDIYVKRLKKGEVLNIFEAANECEDKTLNLMFRESQKLHVQIVSIENTYLNKDIDTIKIFEKGFSGKDKHTGIGLWEVNKIIKKFNNIVLKTSKDDKLFKQELQIYY